MSTLKSKDSKAYQEWITLCDQIRKQTEGIFDETPESKEIRKKELQNDFVKFCKYYFSRFMDSEFGWFHLKAAEAIKNDPKVFAVLEWPREHAKSVFANIMMPLFLYARGEFTGMITVSANETKAITLLSDLQAEFVANQRWINDYGELAKLGDWTEGNFSTTDGIGFWAYGRGQSPRGARKAVNRPNYAVVDDIDDKVIVKNADRVKEAVNWVIEDLYGSLAMKGGRLVIAGNRINKASILANLVGDVKEGDSKRKGITHIKVFAIEHRNTHTKAEPTDKTAQPAWNERYTMELLLDKFDKMGHRSTRREFFHEHQEEGNVFKPEWIQYGDVLPFKKYNSLTVYCDPSFKDSKTSDYKAIITVGILGSRIDILTIWLRQASSVAMVNVFYDLFDDFENWAKYYMEANMLQDLLMKDFDQEAESRDYSVPVRKDMRSKPDKATRIENLTPYFERGKVTINKALQGSPDCDEFIDQLMGFPFGHDDGPDALEGAIFKGSKRADGSTFKPRSGMYEKSSRHN